MKERKKLGLDRTLELIKEGYNPSKICKEYKIPKQTISYYVDKLKKLGCIEKRGYGVWKFIRKVPIRPKGSISSQSRTSKKKEIRGHAFIWKIDFFEPPNWKRYIINSTLKYQKIHQEKTIRILYKGRKIWLKKDGGMIIYEPLDFLGTSSFHVKGMAVYEMDLLIKSLFRRMKIKFRPYRFTTSREHFAHIKNELARQYNEKKEKLFVRSEEGTFWLWIDHSKGENELEVGNIKDAPIISRQAQNWYNDQRKTKFEVTPTFILNSMHGIQENQVAFDRNMKSHIKAVQDLGKGVRKFTKAINNLHRKRRGKN